MGFPIALKLISPSISSKSDVGGVVLNLNDPDEVEQTAFAILLRIKNTYPNAHIKGFSLQNWHQSRISRTTYCSENRP